MSKLGGEEQSYPRPKHWLEGVERGRPRESKTEKGRERYGQSVEPNGECDSGNGAFITINKQLSPCLDSTGLADLPQMTEQLKDCLARGDTVNIS